MQGKIKPIIPLALTMFFIFFITLISRTPTLTRTTHFVPRWSYAQLLGGRGGKQILLNILLFIPLGYFLCRLLRPRRAVLISLAVSAAIELLQYATYRGMLDVDDLISNGLGAAAGVLIYKLVSSSETRGRIEENKSGKDEGKPQGRAKKAVSGMLLGAGLVGCLMVGVPAAKRSVSAQVTRLFWFDANTSIVGNELLLYGSCYTYDRATPAYTLLLGDQALPTTIDGNHFSATAGKVKEKSELQIRFSGYSPMPTGIYIRPDGGIDYVDGAPSPDVALPDGATLKAYNSEFDTFVYLIPEEEARSADKLMWLIGWEGLDNTTEIIYHLHTNTPDLLPENRIQYKFDNRGFRAKADEPAPK